MTSLRRSRLSVVRAYILLPHLTPIIAVMTGTAAFAWIARGGWPGGVDFSMLMVAMFGGQIAVGAVNELVDVELDRVSKPSKPLVTGLATERGARVMAGTGMVLMALGSLRFSLMALALCAFGNGAGRCLQLLVQAYAVVVGALCARDSVAADVGMDSARGGAGGVGGAVPHRRAGDRRAANRAVDP